MARPVKCNLCWHVFRGGGAARTMRKIAFFFCDSCWRNRKRCEEWMRKVAL
jgi:hypothetical protein